MCSCVQLDALLTKLTVLTEPDVRLYAFNTCLGCSKVTVKMGQAVLVSDFIATHSNHTPVPAVLSGPVPSQSPMGAKNGEVFAGIFEGLDDLSNIVLLSAALYHSR